MATYSFSLESFDAVVCRSKAGLDDIWLIVTVNLGTRSTVAVWSLGTGVQPGQVFTGPWTAGPYQAASGETGGTTYTFVNLAGSSTEDQEKIIGGLASSLLSAVTSVAGFAQAAVEAAMRGVFGSMGELLAAPAVPAGAPDCRGLIGLAIQPFTAAGEPAEPLVETGAPVTLNGTAPATCGSGPQGTGPQSTAVFSVRRAPSLFSQSTPVTVLPTGPMTEVFAVGMDGLVRYNVRTGSASFSAWQVASQQTFSQSAPLVALAGAAQRKDVFGTGTNGVIYRWSWTPATGWGDWTAVSALGQFLPDTPVSAILAGGVTSLFAVNPDGVAQTITWSGDTLLSTWTPIPATVLAAPGQSSVVFARRTPLLAISHIDPWVEIFAVDSLGQDFHTSRPINGQTWGVWERLGAVSEPASHRYLGLTFDVFTAANASAGLGMTWLRVDGAGLVNQLAWNNGTGWMPRRVIPGFKTAISGSVSGVRMGNQLLLYMIDGQTGKMGVASWTMPVPFNSGAAWSGWTVLPSSPAVAKERAITMVSADANHVELFVVDLNGLVQHVTEDTGPGWGTWSVV